MKTRGIPLTEKDIEEKIRLRKEARDQKNWAHADTIRGELLEADIVLEDRTDETVWKIKVGK
jgi:cysteinyl-tRNA synthetase